MIRKVVLVGLAAGLTASGLAQRPGQGPARQRWARTIVQSPQPSPAQPLSQAPAQPLSQAPALPLSQAPALPVVAPRPDQMSPVAPQVTYQNGQLSIQAQNSTLSSILSAVHARTGARVEMPADTASERVAAQLVGSPRDVLAALLQGSRYDYIVMGSLTDPDALSSIILTPHGGSSGGTPASAAGNQLPQGGGQPRMMPSIAGSAGRPEINGDEDETAAEPEPVPQPPPPQMAPQQGVMGAEQLGQPNPGLSPGGETGQQQKPNQVKTPEQLLQELQRMQQQQQQPGRRQPQQE